jgi:hypothetical protein
VVEEHLGSHSFTAHAVADCHCVHSQPMTVGRLLLLSWGYETPFRVHGVRKAARRGRESVIRLPEL